MARSLSSTVPTLLAGLLAAITLVGCGAAQKRHAEMQQQGESLRIELAELYVQKNARQAAIPLLQRIIAERPLEVRARILYGTVLRDLGLYPQAEAELRRALQIEANRSDAHAAIAILLDLTGRHDEALKHHVLATRLAPGSADYRNNLGFSLLAAGEAGKAIAPLEAALALDPGLAHAYANLGFAYGRAGRLDDAERTFRAGLGEAGALINLSLVHAERGDAATAAALRERAYILSPDIRPTALTMESP
jgi:Tfp pilus assembly protein PilF